MELNTLKQVPYLYQVFNSQSGNPKLEVTNHTLWDHLKWFASLIGNDNPNDIALEATELLKEFKEYLKNQDRYILKSISETYLGDESHTYIFIFQDTEYDAFKEPKIFDPNFQDPEARKLWLINNIFEYRAFFSLYFMEFHSSVVTEPHGQHIIFTISCNLDEE